MKKEKPRRPMEVRQPGEVNTYLENILRLQVENPRAYAVLSPGLKFAAGRYAELKEREQSKAA
jgi:hypothetical protein